MSDYYDAQPEDERLIPDGDDYEERKLRWVDEDYAYEQARQKKIDKEFINDHQ